MSSEELERVTKAGLRHSLALSGQHLAVVGLLALLPVFFLERLYPSLLMIAPRRLLVATISLPLAALCLWLGNAPPSLIRSAWMLFIWVLLQWRSRPMTLLDGLCMVLACMMLADPLCVLDIGATVGAGRGGHCDRPPPVAELGRTSSGFLYAGRGVCGRACGARGAG